MTSIFCPGFPVVPDDKKIETMQFLEACEKIPALFDLLGGHVFYPVKNDIIGTIEGVKNRFLENLVRFATLDDIIKIEKQARAKNLKMKDGNESATISLMWLKRGLKFILLFLEHLIKNDYDPQNPENLKACARLDYKDSFQEYHGWFVSQAVSAATNACPNRTVFLKSLADHEGVNEKETMKRAAEFAINYRATVDAIYELYDRTGVEKFNKV